MNIIDAINSNKQFRRLGWDGWMDRGRVRVRNQHGCYVTLHTEDIIADDWEVLICEKCETTVSGDAAALQTVNIVCNCGQSVHIKTKEGHVRFDLVWNIKVVKGANFNVEFIKKVSDTSEELRRFIGVDSGLEESINKKCDCGAKSVGCSSHSDWCQTKGDSNE